MKQFIQIAGVLLTLAGFGAFSHAGVINFETLPDGSPATDNAPIPLGSTYILNTLKFEIGFDSTNDGNIDSEAFLEAMGNDAQNSFVGEGGTDGAAPGFEDQLGNFFLRSAEGFGTTPFPTMIIQYLGPDYPNSAEGQIWDIDGSGGLTEQWQVRMYSPLGNLQRSIDSPIGLTPTGPYDARPWDWLFEGAGEVGRVEIDFIGTKTAGIGLAFDNFAVYNPTPEPHTLGFIGVGMIMLLGLRRVRH